MKQMKEVSISFNNKGYDGFIDFIKAYSIICVLFGHTFGFLLDKVAYCAWAGMQVPYFILVQTFHCYKKERPSTNLPKVMCRVMLPFLVLEIITFGIALLAGNDIEGLFGIALKVGGYGPGSYFPWIYLQVAVLLPLFSQILNRFNNITSFLIFILLSEGFELFFSYVNISEEAYRLLFPRYLFLLYLGWLWAKEGVKINRLTLLLSLLSLATVIYFEYFSINDEPWFYSTGFKYHRWPCYFFVSFGLTALLYTIWNKLRAYEYISRFVKSLASASYEIFLVQMSLLFLFHTQTLFFIQNVIVRYLLWVLIVWIISLFGGLFLNRIIFFINGKLPKAK